MEVKRVVVDELPEGCERCELWFANGLNGLGVCYATKLEMSERYLYQQRPDWCPLVVESEE